MFFEASAKSGYMVETAIVAMAAKLRTREDIRMENVSFFQLDQDNNTNNVIAAQDGDDQNNKKCCRI